LCRARCCTLQVERSAEDAELAPLRWDAAGRWLVRSDDGYCSHNDPSSRRCTDYTNRPANCRRFDCRDDPRIWADYARRIPAPLANMAAQGHVPSICVPIEQLC